MLGPGKGPHVASFRCKSCGAFRGWCSKDLYSDLTQGERTDALEAAMNRARDPGAASTRRARP
jgi:hypothetical protein